MKIRTIRKRNKRQMIYAYTVQVGTDQEVSRRIATRDRSIVGIVRLEKPAPAGTMMAVSYSFHAG